MINRKQKVAELLADFQSLRRSMTFRGSRSVDMPRVTPSQWGVLMFIAEHKEAAVKDVASALHITSSAATQLIDGLVASGYLVREPSAQDRRTVILTLSKKSKSQVERMKRHALQKFLKFFEVLNDTEFNHYMRLNKKIVERFSKK